MNKAIRNKYIAHAAAMALIASFLICIAASAALYELKEQSKYVKKDCSDFSSYKDAQEALKNGQVGLDKDKDGIACNSLKR